MLTLEQDPVDEGGDDDSELEEDRPDNGAHVMQRVCGGKKKTSVGQLKLSAAASSFSRADRTRLRASQTHTVQNEPTPHFLSPAVEGSRVGRGWDRWILAGPTEAAVLNSLRT